MIPIIRMPGAFTYSEYEDAIWESIFQTIDSVPGDTPFQFCFYATEHDKIPVIAESVTKHNKVNPHLTLKTSIKLYSLCKSEYVFLDISNSVITQSRFSIFGEGIDSIIYGLQFLKSHYNFISNKNLDDQNLDAGKEYNVRKQKRNDSSNYDRKKYH